MNENKKRNIVLIIVTLCVMILSGFGFFQTNKDKTTQEIVDSAMNELKDYISTYEMSEEEVKQLPSTEIVEQSIEEEQTVSQEQEIEEESFELQRRNSI